MKHQRLINDDPTWIMWKCDKGKRWTSVNGRPLEINGDIDGGFCLFSECAENDHRHHVIGETADRHTAAEWFRREVPQADVRGKNEKRKEGDHRSLAGAGLDRAQDSGAG